MSSYEIANIVTAVASLITAAVAVWISYGVSKSERRLAQRQLLVPLWQYMTDLNEINPAQPVTPDVLKAANALELVALCCEGEMIDVTVIKRTFRDTFLVIYDQIDQCMNIPGLGKSGKKLLLEYRAASSFYSELKKEHEQLGRIK